MRCYCNKIAGSCVCESTYVVYKLKCRACFQCYIGKTKRAFWIRIAEHMKGLLRYNGTTLANHKCQLGFEIQVLARSQPNSKALGILEEKMMNKYKPRINIKNEKKAQEEAARLGMALRDKGLCKPFDKLREANEDNEDQFEYWIGSPDFVSSQVDREDDASSITEEEASKFTEGEQYCIFSRYDLQALRSILA